MTMFFFFMLESFDQHFILKRNEVQISLTYNSIQVYRVDTIGSVVDLKTELYKLCLLTNHDIGTK